MPYKLKINLAEQGVTSHIFKRRARACPLPVLASYKGLPYEFIGIIISPNYATASIGKGLSVLPPALSKNTSDSKRLMPEIYKEAKGLTRDEPGMRKECPATKP